MSESGRGLGRQVTESDLLKTAKERFKRASEAWQKQREREKEDLRFQVPEEQWADQARRARESADGIPARPILSVSLLDQPIQLLLNQERTARLGVQIAPLSPDAEPEVARVLEGIYRRIERDSQAGLARSWAFERAVKAGRGAYLVNTRYADEEGGDDFDQIVTIERILHQENVYFDPAATKADFSDGEYAFVTAWMPLADFKREFPESEIAKGDASAEGPLTWADEVQEQPDWVRGDGETAAVLVAWYFYKVHTPEKVTATDGSGRTRTKDVIRVHWTKFTGDEVLEEGKTNGRLIPLVPAIGRELQPYDEERRWVGIIGPAKDAQRIHNYSISSAVELAALEPRAPWVGAEGQFEGHETEWAQANIRNKPYLEYKPTTIGDQIVPPPQRTQIDASRLGPSMALVEQSKNFIQAATAVYDPSLGRVSPREKSGRAIMALQQQAESGNSHYLQNEAEISLNCEARIILDLIPAIYDRPGRIARVLDEEGESDTILLNQPFYADPQTKFPQPLEPGQQPPVPPGPPPGPPGAPLPGGNGQLPPRAPQGAAGAPQPSPPKVRHYDLRKGVYSVSVSVGKQKQTAMQEGQEAIGALLEAQPALLPILGPVFFKYSDFPGKNEIAELLKKMRPPQLAGGDGEGPSPEQAAAQVQQLQQQLQLMGAQLQGAVKAIETEQAKQQATLEKSRMDNEAKVRIAESENQTAVLIQQMRNSIEEFKALLGAKAKAAEGERDRAHETELTLVDATINKPEPEPPEPAEPPGEGA